MIIRNVLRQFSWPSTREPELQPLDSRLISWSEAVCKEISRERLKEHITMLPGPRSRLHFPDAMIQASNLMLRVFRESGWAADLHPFSFTDASGYFDYPDYKPTIYPRLEGANIVAISEGEVSRDAIILIGHYDTMRDTVGADDNTASVGALLELAHILAPYRFFHTVILAATDMEELNLFGAKALLAELEQERRILGVINFETMAYTASESMTQFLPPGLGLLFPGQIARMHERQFRGDFTAVIYNGKATRLAASFAAGLARLAGEDVPVLLRDPNDIPIIGKMLGRVVPAVRNFARSDHLPFWMEGLPAIMVTDTANFRYKHYHQLTDTPEKLDYDRLAAIVGAAAITISQVSESLRAPSRA